MRPRGELAYVLGLISVTLLLSAAPYVAGYLASSPEAEFDGAVMNLEDIHCHLATMQQGARGQWRFHLLFTPEDHQGAFLRPLYLTLGHLARLGGLPLTFTYHLARLLCGALSLLSAYAFISLLLRRAMRRIAFFLTCLSSGLGWLWLLLRPTPPGGISPIDFWLNDAYIFFSLFLFPHFAFSIAALLAVFSGALLYETEPRRRYLALVAFASLALALEHPFAILIVMAVLASYGLILWISHGAFPVRLVLPGLICGTISFPVLAYDLLLFYREPVFRAWQAQNYTLSPPPLYYVLGYGLLLPLALVGVMRLWRRRDRRGVFAIAWVATVAVLIYLPIPLQRRMLEGVQVPLSVLAAQGLGGILASLRRSSLLKRLRPPGYPLHKLRLLLLNLLLVSTLPSNLYLVAGATLAAWQRHPSLFHPRTTVEAIDWLETHSAWTDTILSSYETGNYIPARIGHRVFWGHWSGTAWYAQKRRLALTFFGERTDDAWRIAFLREYGIRYLFYGPEEKALGAFDPTGKPYLTPVFSNGRVTVYEVKP